MENKIPRRDPERDYVRKKTAARRVGRRRCACGESRPRALIAHSEPTICAACQRTEHGKTAKDRHHIAAIANSPTTMLVHVNDHRADLTELQERWPTRTRDNPDGSPVLAAAAAIRGFVDTLVYLMTKCVLWVAECLEGVDALLVARFGPTWWAKTDVARFAPTPP
jgi:hypothetical protein